jgi:hypothetical protein
MNKEEEKQARTVIAALLYNPENRHLNQVERTDKLVDYMNVVVKKYRIIEDTSDIQAEAGRNLATLKNGAARCGCDSCCCCCRRAFSLLYNIFKLTLIFMVVFFAICGVLSVLWNGWQLVAQGWRSFLPVAWNSAATAGQPPPNAHGHL